LIIARGQNDSMLNYNLIHVTSLPHGMKWKYTSSIDDSIAVIKKEIGPYIPFIREILDPKNVANSDDILLLNKAENAMFLLINAEDSAGKYFARKIYFEFNTHLHEINSQFKDYGNINSQGLKLLRIKSNRLLRIKKSFIQTFLDAKDDFLQDVIFKDFENLEPDAKIIAVQYLGLIESKERKFERTKRKYLKNLYKREKNSSFYQSPFLKKILINQK
jgi:hypothetical protein